jgi:hypothetical protein
MCYNFHMDDYGICDECGADVTSENHLPGCSVDEVGFDSASE